MSPNHLPALRHTSASNIIGSSSKKAESEVGYCENIYAFNLNRSVIFVLLEINHNG